jgi:AAA family ATP:ADP antiporter
MHTQILIGTFGSLQASTPYLGGILGAIILAWIAAAKSLNKQFLQKSAEMERSEWPLQDFEKKEQ